MSKRRFVAPARADVDPARFAHPLYAWMAPWRDWLLAEDWPAVSAMDAALAAAWHAAGLGEPRVRLVEQSGDVLADGLHYETRIAELGRIATRFGNWHDLLNAAVWCAQPRLKRALNVRHAAQVAQTGTGRRDRVQDAIAQFDEAGAVLAVRDPALPALWDAHDWSGLFHTQADAWRDGRIAIAAVVGHALPELMLLPGLHPVAKCLVVLQAAEGSDAAAVDAVVDAVAQERVLRDPAELRPLPLSGVPGWHAGQDAAFYAQTPCFRPLREGRVYPPPLNASQP